MIQTISIGDFRDAFRNANRKENFSYNGLTELFNYFEGLEEETEEKIELDVINICCSYSEYENLKEFQKDYNKEDYESIEDIREATIVIMLAEESFIIENF